MTPGTQIRNRFDPNATVQVIEGYQGNGFFKIVDIETGKAKSVHMELLRQDYEVVKEGKQEQLDI